MLLPLLQNLQSPPPFSGSSALTLGSLAVAASGQQVFAGNATLTYGNLSLSAAGSISVGISVVPSPPTSSRSVDDTFLWIGTPQYAAPPKRPHLVLFAQAVAALPPPQVRLRMRSWTSRRITATDSLWASGRNYPTATFTSQSVAQGAHFSRAAYSSESRTFIATQNMPHGAPHIPYSSLALRRRWAGLPQLHESVPHPRHGFRDIVQPLGLYMQSRPHSSFHMREFSAALAAYHYQNVATSLSTTQKSHDMLKIIAAILGELLNKGDITL